MHALLTGDSPLTHLALADCGLGDRGAACVLALALSSATLEEMGLSSKIRVPLFAARTLNATGQCRVTLSRR